MSTILCRIGTIHGGAAGLAIIRIGTLTGETHSPQEPEALQ